MSENSTQLMLFPEMESSTSSQQVFHAKTCPLQGTKQELKQTGQVSSSRSSDSVMSSMPIAELDHRCSWRTSQTCLLETGEIGQEPFTQNWPSEGIVASGKLYPQVMWEHLISANDGGVSHIWPTPNAWDGARGPLSKEKMEEGVHQITLVTAVKHFPTPTARDWKDSGPNTNYQKAKEKHRLAGFTGAGLSPDWVEHYLMGYPRGWTNLQTSPE